MTTASSSLSVDDILSDLRILSSTTQDSRDGGTSDAALLRFGQSLLPSDVRGTDTSPLRTTTTSQQLAEIDTLIAQHGQSDAQQQQATSLRLSQSYVALARQMIALNGAQRQMGSSSQDSDAPQPVAFEQLHRRVARLQADNDAEMRRLDEMRALVAGSDDQAASTAV